MRTFKRHLIAASVFTSLTASNVLAEEQKETSAAAELTERIQIIGHGNKLRTEAGSATLIGEVELEKFKFDDISRVLYSVPGVNIREEDGYGLRPNIGFRGATPERSKKITVMEDGILIGPAPYSAPAAYYFPMMSKMTALEVFKGPAAIKYGPNTVAGALNMTTRAVPEVNEGQVDFATGNDSFFKAKAYYGNTVGNFGYLVEGVHIQSDGFKELDGGGDTGFEKQDIMLKLNYDFSNEQFKQIVELKLSYADELSDETYLGLSDDDFAINPNRRYAASQHDKMDWNHQQLQLTHFIANDDFDLTTRLYRNDFERSWFKINGFKQAGSFTPSLQDVLANPTSDAHTNFYQVLTGERDSLAENEKIVLGDNAREYYSQGIQTELSIPMQLLGYTHKLSAGVRFHQDQIKRRHTEDVFLMQGGTLVTDGSATIATTTNMEETDALSVFIQDTISIDRLDLTFGLRGEYLDAYYQNQKPGKSGEWLKKESSIILPSISGFYTVNDDFGLLFGIHEGFVPTSPAEAPEVDIENSVNYELGGRYSNNGTQLELVAFFNDIKNLKESCTFSTSASNCNLDQEYNGSAVDVYGVEFSTSHTFSLDGELDIPVSLVYTYTSSEFKTSFNSDFPMWGQITAGDELPYLPENQLTLSAGVVGDRWEINMIGRYIDEMKEASGQGVTLSNVVTEAYAVVDISAKYDLMEFGAIYLKIDNIFDEQEVVSRRPYGARPTKPMMAQIGYQYSF
ncbi:TonB-dependent receptor family protein [Thalassotalea fusca]